MKSIYRYTKIEYLFDLIDNARLPMVDYSNWEDKNDVYALEKSKNNDETLGICCLTYSRKNSIYRWSKMSQDGVCVRIEFDKGKIERLIKKDKSHYLMKKVRYFNREILSEMCYKDKRDLAFVKHFSYEEEKEIRIVYRGKKSDKKTKNRAKSVVEYLKEIPKDSIKGIRFSPYVSKELFDLIQKPLFDRMQRKKWNISKNAITHSEILDYPKWQKIIDGILLNAVTKKSISKNLSK